MTTVYAARSSNVLDRVVPRVDAWRQPMTGPASEGASYKEWMHFCIRLPGETPGHLLINLNVTERTTIGGALRAPRLIALAYLDNWTGSVESFDVEEVWGPPGGLGMRVGKNALDWRDGSFYLSLCAGDLVAELRIRPLLLPTVTSSVSFGPGHAMHWVVIPRLEASGWVRISDRHLELDRALTYHDHNWGHFRWGGDLSWEWGFVNPTDPTCPWSVVFVRVSDGKRHRTLSQGVLVWSGEELVRTFQNREILMTLDGAHGGERPFTLPKIAALLVPGVSSGVPAHWMVEAAGRGDRLEIDFETTAKARVAVPSDVDDFRLVLLNEACGEARVRGSIRAGNFEFQGAAVMEFVRG